MGKKKASEEKTECPKCRSTFLVEPIERNALSRLTRDGTHKIWVCSDCGVTEALEQYYEGKPKPITLEL